ncbi:MAG: response regulator [Prolixibacteraceae bacterium]|nr:response regulator [Prolixibacteraceae bacterium]
MKFMIEQVDINELLKEVTQLFTPEASKKNLRLLAEFNLPAEKSKFSSDQKQLKKVFTNLIGYTIKFTQNGNINLGYIRHDGFIQFYIKINGTEISDDQKESLFDVNEEITFQRETMLPEHELSCSKAIIKALGGKIWGESESLQGTIIYFQIPDSCPERNYNQKPKKEKLHVLVAEDDIHSLMFLKTLLSLEGIVVYEAVNGKKAIEMVERFPEIDLVLIDMRMPELDGFEATTHIKQINPALPVIAQTAYALREDIENAYKAGCDEYVQKPVKKQILMEKIKKLLPEK